uniref:G_PROTEIN_RECEP_F1_2 domain-containing protein n=1 Tax=Ascaris lumbricoides TaxID=6252 RepID=A0A0M3HMH1_ASCLU
MTVYAAILLRPALTIFVLYLLLVKMKNHDLKVFVLNLYSWSTASDFFATSQVVTSIMGLFNTFYATIW